MGMQHLPGSYKGDTVPERFNSMVEPHLKSYNYFLTSGMANVIAGIEPFEHKITKGEHTMTVRTWLEHIRFERPKDADGKRMWPADCRQAGTTYKGALHATAQVCVEGAQPVPVSVRLGHMPIMVRSTGCWTAGLTCQELLRRKEEAYEMGGYFIVNGIERLIRMVIMPKRHYVTGIKRASNAKRYPSFSEYATAIRCVLPDERGATVRCYYETAGTVRTGVTVGNREAFIPSGILLRALTNISERDVYQHITAAAPQSDGDEAASEFAVFLSRRTEKLLRECHRQGVHTQQEAITKLGMQLRDKMQLRNSERTDHEVGKEFLRDYLFIHLDRAEDKFLLLVMMIQKVYALAAGECSEDNPDALAHHEVLLAGPVLAKALRERLLDWGEELGRLFQRDASRSGKFEPTNERYLSLTLNKLFDVGGKLAYLLTTGNFKVDNTKRRPDIPQQTGFTVVAEKLNWYRYISHFRSVHRGAYFNDSRTSSVRKLLPEGWGFLCPVHTPDGGPCGLLNHLAAPCVVVTHPDTGPNNDVDEVHSDISRLLVRLGMRPASGLLASPSASQALHVTLDGTVLGYLAYDIAPQVVRVLRRIKAAKLASEQGRQQRPLEDWERVFPSHAEVAYLPRRKGAPFPSLCIFTSTSRLMRPVKQLPSGDVEMVGPLEQVALDIRCPDGGPGGTDGLPFTHEEIDNVAMLSIVASLTPYSDFNQSPRNMYQCQMGKQTMGTPLHSYPYRPDGKLYRLLTPQTPIARTQRYDQYLIDEFPNGTNAVVAVLAYTGYDMEDGMILNQAAVDRGFAHGSLYKNELHDVREEGRYVRAFKQPAKPKQLWKKRQRGKLGLWEVPLPCNIPATSNSEAVKGKSIAPEQQYLASDRIDVDGLPHVGAVIHPGQEYYNVHDVENGRDRAGFLKGKEVAVVDSVTLIGQGSGRGAHGDIHGPSKASIKLRFNRNPIIGDKFSSRHGQKGVLSKLWPDSDMPFSAATGMRPDLIINPNAFPSRMTIGMLIESMTSKAGALKGEWVDATPFQTAGGQREHPAEVFGRALEKAGFAKWGGETMISGITGEEFAADIYMGCVYYQRLRHMVSDKFQVRATGAVDPVMWQPIKGRKVGGGIRFGEMERDSLLAHGAAYLLHDRLHSSSDYRPCYLCNQCGSLLSPTWVPFHTPKSGQQYIHTTRNLGISRGTWECTLCQTGKFIESVAIPAVFKYLVVELAAMNLKVSVHVADPRIHREA